MFLQVIMTQLCTAVYIMCPHVLRAASSAAIQLFAQDDSDHSSSTSEPLVNSQQESGNTAAVMCPGHADLLPLNCLCTKSFPFF